MLILSSKIITLKIKRMLISLDISTSVIGITSFDEETGNLIELDYIKFKSGKTIFEKLEDFKEKIKHYEGADVKYIGIEEPLKKFMGKFSSATTISLLNFFNGMISSYMYLTFGVEPWYMHVSTVRKTAFPHIKLNKKDTKHEIWSQVKNCEPQINWKYSKITMKLMQENYDMTDAYVVGRAYLRTLDESGKISLAEDYFKVIE